MKKILVATDGSAGSDRAVDVAAELAKSLSAGLLILTILEPPSRETIEAYKSIEHVAESEVAALTAHSLLVSARERANRAGATDVQHQSETGDPTEMILQVAKQRKADAIVVGKRGRGNLAGLLLGSVSQKLVSLAPCNVVVVP
jgi:nucleotide-binding universal stress UspA family protein